MSGQREIYLITNTITNRTYVGKSGLASWRIREHLMALKNGYHPVELMQEDSFTFGYESFTTKIFGSYEELEASRMEIFMMKMLRTQDTRFGYNYKDTSGNSKFAVQDRWRTPPFAWRPGFRKWFRENHTNWRVNRLPYHPTEPINPNLLY